jgi:DNA ligase D-like protein (predicted ligase)/DNA ligase D-like protein (predicted 3'-phosphoesterase)
MNTYKPMLARSREKPFDSPDWVYEAKWDGIRALAYVGEPLSIRSRNDRELSHKFPELRELTGLSSDVVLDGEIIVMNQGRVDFQTVAKRNMVEKSQDIEDLRRRHPAAYIVFDILESGGVPLIDLPLSERKKILGEAVQEGEHVTHSPTVDVDGLAYYKATGKQGLEGIIAKRKASTYQPGVRSSDWLKIKHVKTCDCVIFGYTPGEGARSSTFGALILGLYDAGEPVYVGRVGTGFSDESLSEIKSLLDAELVGEPWFSDGDIPKGAVWVQPRYVAQIGYQEFTKDGRLRAPRFQGLRPEKTPALSNISQVKPLRLEEYFSKRDFSKTPEPIGEEAIPQGNSFVVQEHHARRTHWDLRLERDGALRSWAVPKGVPEEADIRRLAIETEDHPLEYGGFEGIIPRGQYGAGTVEIWDRGFYVPVKWQKDKIEVVIAGERLRGRYELVKMKEEKQWLLFKKK